VSREHGHPSKIVSLNRVEFSGCRELPACAKVSTRGASHGGREDPLERKTQKEKTQDLAGEIKSISLGNQRGKNKSDGPLINESKENAGGKGVVQNANGAGWVIFIGKHDSRTGGV